MALKRAFTSDNPDCDIQVVPPSRPFWLVLLLGLAAGAGGGLLGVGGGIIMIPVLTKWGFSQKCAQGTSLVVITAIAPLAIYMYAFLGHANFAFALPLAIGGLIGGEIGSRAALKFSNRMLGIAFSMLIIIIAVKMFFPQIHGTGTENALGTTELVEAGLLGIIAGLAAGFFGVGGGIVFVPIGVLLGGLSQQSAQGCSWTAIFPTSALCANRYRIGKEVAWNIAKWLIPGALVGVVIGAKWASLLPGRELQIIFALYLMYTGVHRLFREWNKSREARASCRQK